ncbi:hypothetical protein CANARDRAFT_25229 [[Candida] arabinofermentans NRRL YB-2248]|uniref:C3H1-type domain-containing protein n=1 Tax=[Candida] arabinofermentans NRRL YB-2248 TaxID=983967 RepID=A0A1E4SUS0_9ASCO|nr:hypothetical protein CANARDRAFT_25229 [[Candida] arabinofermentans NRRL YB-2248]
MTSIWNSAATTTDNIDLDRHIAKMNGSSEATSTISETSTIITPTTSTGNLLATLERAKDTHPDTINNNSDTLAMMSLIPNLWADKAEIRTEQHASNLLSSVSLTPSTSIISSTAMESSTTSLNQQSQNQQQQQQSYVWNTSSAGTPTTPVSTGTSMPPLNNSQLNHQLPHEILMAPQFPLQNQQQNSFNHQFYQPVQQQQHQHQHQHYYSQPNYPQPMSAATSQPFFPSGLPSSSTIQIPNQFSQLSNNAQLRFPLTEENLSLLGQVDPHRRSNSPQLINPPFSPNMNGNGNGRQSQQPAQSSPFQSPQLRNSAQYEIPTKQQQQQLDSQSAANAAAAAAQSQSQRQGKNTIDKELYKSEMCVQFQTKGNCPYGSKCQFAHGKFELKQVKRAVNWKTKPCSNWSKTGCCRYGKRCCFKHGDDDNSIEC